MFSCFQSWDASHLASSWRGPSSTLLVDQGSADDFLTKGQLLPENLISAVSTRGDDTLKVEYQLRDGYDHSYYFIQTFIGEHIEFHAKNLGAQ